MTTVRGFVWATDASAAQTFSRCAQEAGDTVVLIAAGGNKVTSLDPSMPTVDCQTGQEAQGFIGVETSDGSAGADFTAYFDGPDPHALLMVAVPPPERGLVYTWASDRGGLVGASLPESTVTVSMSAKAGNKQVVLAFARNATTLPTCDLGAPTHSAVVGGSAMAAWVTDPGARTETLVTVPGGRSGHYVAAVNFKPTPATVKTYIESAGDHPTVKVLDGYGGATWNTFRTRQVITDTTTETYHEPPGSLEIIGIEADARDGVPNLTTPGPAAGAFTIETSYTAGSTGALPAPPYHTLNDVRHHFHPVGINRRGVPDTVDGEFSWSPNLLDPSEWPDGAIGWEWPDGTDYTTGDVARPAPLVSVVFDGEAQGEPLDTTAHPHTSPSIISAFFAQSGLVTWGELEGGAPSVEGWVPALEHGLAEFSSDGVAVSVELIDLLDAEGRCVLFSKAAMHQSKLAETPLAPDTPGYQVAGSSDGGMTYGYFVETAGSGYFTTTWTYASPAFRWVTSVAQVDVEDVSLVTPPLRHLTRRDGLESTAGRVTGGRSQQGSARRVSGHW